MGNNSSSTDQTSHSSKSGKSSVWFFFQRTWTIFVAEKLTRTRFSRSSRSSDKSEFVSQYSFCSCSQCQKEDEGISSGTCSDIYDIESNMAPNMEETSRIARFPHLEDTLSKEKQRPPIYNPEDYASLLKKWGKKSSNGMISLYSNSTTSDFDCNRSQNNTFRDYSNPMLTTAGSEMTLRQFGTVSELLAKLKSDLRLAYPSFVQEFVADPLDGITLLLDLLRAIQLSQSNSNTTGKIPPSIQRRTLLDELSCLQCLLNCCLRYAESVRKLTASSAGLFTLAICIMSNVNKSRITALQLLTKACDPPTSGHSQVSEAMSTLRLRFGEPVRFRFLVGMLSSAGGQKELLTAGLKFINTFLNSSGSRQKRLYLQAELEQAGFDILTMKKNMGSSLILGEPVVEQFDTWEKNHIDIEKIFQKLETVEKENAKYREKNILLERKIQILQEEKGVLQSLEQCLKEKCSELQGEVHSLKSGLSQKDMTCLEEKKDGSTPEDEGISSSERSLTPEDIEHSTTVYDLYGMHCKPVLDPTINQNQQNSEELEDEETTVDEVIEELKNIINDAETEMHNKEIMKKAEERKRTEEAQVASKIQLRIDIDDYAISSECEIIPSNLHPQPPRKTRSLVHLFIPTEDYEYCNKEFFFENETAFTSDEGSDSLLSSSKFYQLQMGSGLLPKVDSQDAAKPKPGKPTIKRCESFRHVSKTVVGPMPKQPPPTPPRYIYSGSPTRKHQEPERRHSENLGGNRTKCKSLDRINEGIDSFIDIVVTNQGKDKSRSKSDSGNVSAVSLSRSISNVLVSPRKESVSKLSLNSEEKQRMFLPTLTDEVPYYFPRIQEKRNSTCSSFLIKRGHTNAGLYSGQVVIDNHHSFMNKREFVHTNNSVVAGKVTDFPSGLY